MKSDGLIFLLLLFNHSFLMQKLYGRPLRALPEFCKGGDVCYAAGVLLLCIALCTSVLVQHCGSEIEL